MKHSFAKILGDFTNEKKVMNSMLKACHENNFHPLKTIEHSFYPYGYSAVILLAESHFAIHTFPEESYANVDLYCCNEKLIPANVIYSFLCLMNASVENLKTMER